MEICKYGGWDNNIKLSNGKVDLVITIDVGPRILRFGFTGQPNVFKEFKAQLGGTHEKEWMIRGGHRLWIAPEAAVSYDIDNESVSYREISPLHVVLPSKPDTQSGWQKELEVKLEKDANRVTVTHRVKNISDRPVYLAVWALSVMDANGTAVLPHPPKGSHPENLLPDRKIVLWPYTDMEDPRFIKKFGGKNFLVKQSSALHTQPTKLGLLHQQGWAGYQIGKQLFAKSVPLVPDANYPDYGCNFELFTNSEMLEVESLAPLVVLEPGKTTEHIEKWALLEQSTPITPDTEIDGAVKKALGI